MAVRRGARHWTCHRRNPTLVNETTPHPEEHREAMRLEGWEPVVMLPPLRDAPGVYPEVLEGGAPQGEGIGLSPAVRFLPLFLVSGALPEKTRRRSATVADCAPGWRRSRRRCSRAPSSWARRCGRCGRNRGRRTS